jgi:hypothetical protein
MLNILKKKQNIFNDKTLNNNYINEQKIKIYNESHKDEYKNTIYYPSSTKEWYNSVYSYNKSYIKPLIVLDAILNNLFRSYFNMLESKIKVFFRRRRTNKIRYSANKLFVSRAELKHTNTKLTVILYIYNKQKSSIERYIRKAFISKIMHKKRLICILKKRFFFFKEWNYVFFRKTDNIIKYLELNSNTDSLIKDTLFNLKKRDNTIKHLELNSNTDSLIKDVLFNLKKRNNLIKHLVFNLNTDSLIKDALFNFKNNSINYTDFKDSINEQKDLFTLEEKFISNIKLINFNKSKFSNLVLNFMDLGIKSFIEKIYNKNVEIKLVELKSVHLNSDIFSSAVALKLRDRQNKVVRVLRKAILQMVKIPTLHTLITFDDNIENINKNNILNVIKQQVVSGIRFEASGRLTRRLTALRAVFKVRYTGSLKNIRSSLNNKSSTMLRGHVKSNSQYTIIDSKTRNGSFGLKGWVSSH